MSELLFTQDDLTSYVDSLDSNNPNNFKVLSSLYLLKPSLFTDIIYLLINGRINISSLYNVQINNYTVQQLVNTAYLNPATIVERSIFYKNFIKTLNNFNTEMTAINLQFPNYLGARNLSSSTFAKEIIIDPLRLINDSYTNLKEAQLIYNNTKVNYITDLNNVSVATGFTTFTYSETLLTTNNTVYTLSFTPNSGSLQVYKNGIIQILNNNYILNSLNVIFNLPNSVSDIITVTYATSSNIYPNLNIVKNSVVNDINTYKFIYTTSNLLSLDINHNKFFSGFILRSLFNFLKYSKLSENLNWLYNNMASDYNDDIPKNGIYTLKRLLNEYTWSKLNQATDFNSFLDILSKVYFLRIFMLQIYGNSYFPNQLINSEITIFNEIINYFNEIKGILDLFIDDIKVQV